GASGISAGKPSRRSARTVLSPTTIARPIACNESTVVYAKIDGDSRTQVAYALFSMAAMKSTLLPRSCRDLVAGDCRVLGPRATGKNSADFVGACRSRRPRPASAAARRRLRRSLRCGHEAQAESDARLRGQEP